MFIGTFDSTCFQICHLLALNSSQEAHVELASDQHLESLLPGLLRAGDSTESPEAPGAGRLCHRHQESNEELKTPRSDEHAELGIQNTWEGAYVQYMYMFLLCHKRKCHFGLARGRGKAFKC